VLHQVSQLQEVKQMDAGCKRELVVNFEIVGQAVPLEMEIGKEVGALELLPGVAAVSESDFGSEA
jgi:hypothetical protein